jgi:histone H3/H4
VLARDTQPIPPTPKTQARLSRRSALDLPDIDDDEPAAPRFSMALDDMYDDDSFNEEPPRQSLLAPLPDYDYDNGTVQSVEFGRRARSEDPRMDRMFGRRISEQFGDLQDLNINGEEYELDGNFINRRGTLLPNDLLEQVEEEDMDNTTSEIRALTGRRDGRPSDVDLGVFGDADEEDEEPTFRFTIPPRMQVPVEEEDEEDDGREDEVDVDEETQRGFDRTIIEDDEDVQAGVDLASDDEPAPVLADDDVTGPLEIAGWESEPEADDDEDLQAYRGEISAIDRSLQTPAPETPAKKRAGRQRRALNISRFGHEYPSFPAATVKTLANGFIKSQGSKSKISKDTLAALVQTSDFFFEQVGEDLAAYAQHAGRKMIEEGDVIALLKRYVHVTIFLLLVALRLLHVATLPARTCYTAIFTYTDGRAGRARLQIVVHVSPWRRSCCPGSCSSSCAWSRCRN